jgi:hypothetical protein
MPDGERNTDAGSLALDRVKAACAGAEARWTNRDAGVRSVVSVRLSATELQQVDSLVVQLSVGRSDWSPVSRSEAIRHAVRLAAGERNTDAGEVV